MTPTRVPTASEGIAREKHLLAARQPATLVWQPEAQALVAPTAWLRREEVQAVLPELAAVDWPVSARSSGGGAVPQVPGTLNLSVILPVTSSFRVEHGYRLICGMMTDALTRFGIVPDTGPVNGAFCDGAWNVTVAGRKLAGTAQRWQGAPAARSALLHAAVQITPLPASVWTALDRLYQAAGQSTLPRPDAHVTLAELIPEPARRAAFAAALAQAAADHLTNAHQGRFSP